MVADSQAGQNSNSDRSSPESWKIADNYARLIGDIPSSFSTTVRTLRQNHQDNIAKNTKGLSSSGRFMISRLVKSWGMKIPLYYMGMTLHSEALDAKPVLTDKDLLSVFSCDELSSVIGVVYLYKRAQKVLDGVEDWKFLAEELQKQMEIGAHVGLAITKVGAGDGLMLGAIRYIALSMILKHDPKGFKIYRRQLKAQGKAFDLDYEMTTWRCTHLQIASRLLQYLGYGIAAATGLSMGLDPVLSKGLELDEASYRWQVAGLWIESMRKTGKVPDITHKGAFYPLKNNLDRLLANSKKVNESVSAFNWIEKAKEDLDEKAKRHLGLLAAKVAAKNDVEDKDVTEILDTELSDEELAAMSEEEDV